MNWQEIEQKYPNAFEIWRQYEIETVPFREIFIDTKERYLEYLLNSRFQSLWGWILDFFRSKEIYITMDENGLCDIWMGIQGFYNINYSMDDQKATEKAYEILEQNYQNKIV